jgi:PhnB protein
MLGDASPEFEPTRSSIHLYVDDVDADYKRALDAGGTSFREPTDQFYGDRSAGIQDRFGNQWWLATHVEDVSPEEMQRRQAAMAQA